MSLYLTRIMTAPRHDGAPQHAFFFMTEPSASGRALTFAAFGTLLLIALMMGANHVAARIAFDHGVDVITAVTFRSAVTAPEAFSLAST